MVLLAILALLVGGVGILNIMLISVGERRREIGVRVALGARPRQILDAFLLEAVIISLAGGGVGILIGSGVPVLLTALFDISVPISSLSVAFALVVSASVGIFFGYYPARRAARLDAVQALHYE